MNKLYYLSLRQSSELLRRREISSHELTLALIRRIEDVEPKIKAFVTLTPELALRQAEEADRMLARGEGGPLCGVPVAIKDNICTRGVRTTCSSKMLENLIPTYDATVLSRLKQEGMVLLGKTNMDEFAMGSSTENSAFFPTHNPWDLSRVPGGSSGGSAAAVAAGEAIYSLGSDTGGSIRQPASFCGVTGLKPTYGLVSRFGLVAFASSLDQIGPITRDVWDCALVLDAIAGHDPRDATSVQKQTPNYSKALIPDIKGLRLGVPKEYFPEEMDPGVRRVLLDAIAKFEEMGAEVGWEVSLPHTKYALAAYYIVAPSEASANLARYDGVRYGFSFRGGGNMWEDIEGTRMFGFGAEVKRRIMLGTYALSAGYYDAYYLKALKVRTLLRGELNEAFRKYHALLTPTSPTTAFRLGEKTADPLKMYLSDVFTIPVNMAGIPAISIPAGFDNHLPVGLQILGPPFGEEMVLRIAFAFQQATNHHLIHPPL